jgi:hypothetical protein
MVKDMEERRIEAFRKIEAILDNKKRNNEQKERLIEPLREQMSQINDEINWLVRDRPGYSRGVPPEEIAKLIRANELTQQAVEQYERQKKEGERRQEGNLLVDQYFARLDAMTPQAQEDYLGKQTLGDIMRLMQPMTQAERDELVRRTQAMTPPEEIEKLKRANELTEQQVKPLLTRKPEEQRALTALDERNRQRRMDAEASQTGEKKSEPLSRKFIESGGYRYDLYLQTRTLSAEPAQERQPQEPQLTPDRLAQRNFEKDYVTSLREQQREPNGRDR